METVKAYWAKFVAMIKTAPAVYAYGVATGVAIGWVLL